MKKLKLKSTAFAGAEVLSRTQLKNVMGGFAAPGDGGGNCGTSECSSDSDCTEQYPKCNISTCASDKTAANYCYCPTSSSGCKAAV